MDMLTRLITKIEIMPIKAITIYAGSEYTCFQRIELESSYRFTPITRQTDLGHNRTVAYTVELTVYLPHALFAKFGATEDFVEGVDDSDHLLTRLNELQAVVGGVDTHLLLGAGSWNPGGIAVSGVSNATGGVTIDCGALGFNYEIESVEFRPRTVLHFNGVVRDIGISSGDIEFTTPTTGG